MIDRKKDISPSTVARKAASVELVLGDGGGIELVCFWWEEEAFEDGETAIRVDERGGRLCY